MFVKYDIDNLPGDELKEFFSENSSFIFLTFSDSFFAFEVDGKQKGIFKICNI